MLHLKVLSYEEYDNTQPEDMYEWYFEHKKKLIPVLKMPNFYAIP